MLPARGKDLRACIHCGELKFSKMLTADKPRRRRHMSSKITGSGRRSTGRQDRRSGEESALIAGLHSSRGAFVL